MGRIKSTVKYKKKVLQETSNQVNNFPDSSRNKNTRKKSNMETLTNSSTKRRTRESEINETPKKLDSAIKKYNITPCVVRLSTRIKNLNSKKICEDTTLNKTQTESPRPTRLLRKRNLPPNKYNEISIISPESNKIEKKSVENPLAVYEFEFDPSEEPKRQKKGRKKNKSESSEEDDNSMKDIVKKLRRNKPAVTKKIVKKTTETQGNGHGAAEKQLKVQVSKTIETRGNKHRVAEKQLNVPKQKTVEIKQKEPHLKTVENQKNEYEVADKQLNGPERLKMQVSKTIDSQESEHEVPEKQLRVQVSKTIETRGNKHRVAEKQLNGPKQLKGQVLKTVEIKQKEPHLKTVENQKNEHEVAGKHLKTAEKQETKKTRQYDNKTVEDPSLSNDSFNIAEHPVDSSILARNIVEEVTKSFIDDLSDEEITKNNNKIFNSTSHDLKPASPWRLNISAVKRPQFFTYKDKSFTPRYEPEILFDIDKALKISNKNTEKIKRTHQTSIENFLTGQTKTIEDKNLSLFDDIPKKSPRKILGEINLVQSTPLRAKINILKSPNLSLISPKKKSDSLFGFSYFSDETNKENLPQSPKKVKLMLSPKKNTKKTEKLILKDTEIINKENMFETPQENTENIPLFRDIDSCQKTIRKYVRKQPKRKRLLSVESVHSEAESEPEEHCPKKKKQKDARTKKEEEEIDKLASHYNSMFEEIEKYPLLIE